MPEAPYLVRVTQLESGEAVDTQKYALENLWAAAESTKDEQKRLDRKMRDEFPRWSKRYVRLYLVVDDGDEWVSYEVDPSQDQAGYYAATKPNALLDQHT